MFRVSTKKKEYKKRRGCTPNTSDITKKYSFLYPPPLYRSKKRRRRRHTDRQRERDDVVKDEESARWRERIRAHRPTGVPVGV